MWSVSFHRQSPEPTGTRNFSYASENDRINRAPRQTRSGGPRELTRGGVCPLLDVDPARERDGGSQWPTFRNDNCSVGRQGRFARGRWRRWNDFECDRAIGRSESADFWNQCGITWFFDLRELTSISRSGRMHRQGKNDV